MQSYLPSNDRVVGLFSLLFILKWKLVRNAQSPWFYRCLELEIPIHPLLYFIAKPSHSFQATHPFHTHSSKNLGVERLGMRPLPDPVLPHCRSQTHLLRSSLLPHCRYSLVNLWPYIPSRQHHCSHQGSPPIYWSLY